MASELLIDTLDNIIKSKHQLSDYFRSEVIRIIKNVILGNESVDSNLYTIILEGICVSKEILDEVLYIELIDIICVKCETFLDYNFIKLKYHYSRSNLDDNSNKMLNITISDKLFNMLLHSYDDDDIDALLKYQKNYNRDTITSYERFNKIIRICFNIVQNSHHYLKDYVCGIEVYLEIATETHKDYFIRSITEHPTLWVKSIIWSTVLEYTPYIQSMIIEYLPYNEEIYEQAVSNIPDMFEAYLSIPFVDKIIFIETIEISPGYEFNDILAILHNKCNNIVLTDSIACEDDDLIYLVNKYRGITQAKTFYQHINAEKLWKLSFQRLLVFNENLMKLSADVHKI